METDAIGIDLDSPCMVPEISEKIYQKVLILV